MGDDQSPIISVAPLRPAEIIIIIIKGEMPSFFGVWRFARSCLRPTRRLTTAMAPTHVLRALWTSMQPHELSLTTLPIATTDYTVNRRIACTLMCAATLSCGCPRLPAVASEPGFTPLGVAEKELPPARSPVHPRKAPPLAQTRRLQPSCEQRVVGDLQQPPPVEGCSSPTFCLPGRRPTSGQPSARRARKVAEGAASGVGVTGARDRPPSARLWLERGPAATAELRESRW